MSWRREAHRVDKKSTASEIGGENGVTGAKLGVSNKKPPMIKIRVGNYLLVFTSRLFDECKVQFSGLVMYWGQKTDFSGWGVNSSFQSPLPLNLALFLPKSIIPFKDWDLEMWLTSIHLFIHSRSIYKTSTIMKNSARPWDIGNYNTLSLEEAVWTEWENK